MDTMEQWCKRMMIEVTDEQLVAGYYLESRGLRFCCEFGYENVIQKADDLFERECEKAMVTGSLN